MPLAHRRPNADDRNSESAKPKQNGHSARAALCPATMHAHRVALFESALSEKAIRPTIIFRAKQALVSERNVGTWRSGHRACLPAEEPRRFDCPGAGRHRRRQRSGRERAGASILLLQVSARAVPARGAFARSPGAMDTEKLAGGAPARCCRWRSFWRGL